MYGSGDSDSVCGDSSGRRWVRDPVSHQRIHLSIHPPVHLPTHHRSIHHLSTHPPIYTYFPSTNSSIDQFILHPITHRMPIGRSIHSYTRLSTDPFTHTPITNRFIHLSTHPLRDLFVHLLIHRLIYSFIQPPIDRLVHSLIIHRSIHH